MKCYRVKYVLSFHPHYHATKNVAKVYARHYGEKDNEIELLDITVRHTEVIELLNGKPLEGNSWLDKDTVTVLKTFVFNKHGRLVERL